MSCHPNSLDFYTLTIDGFFRKVTSFSSSFSTTSSYCILANYTGHYNTWTHISFCCRHRGHKSWFHSLLRFSTLPTGANPVRNFDCHLDFPHGHFLLALSIADYAILCSYSMRKGCLFSCQYAADYYFS